MSLNIEHIYLALHTRLSVLFARVLPKPVRAIVEGLLLLVGLFLLAVIFVLHFRHVYRNVEMVDFTVTAIEPSDAQHPVETLARLERQRVFQGDKRDEAGDAANAFLWFDSPCLSPIVDAIQVADLVEVSIGGTDVPRMFYVPERGTVAFDPERDLVRVGEGEEEESEVVAAWAKQPRYRFSREEGYFLLSDDKLRSHQVKLLRFRMSANHSCFGGRFLKRFTERYVGYDTIMVNEVTRVLRKGFLRNELTKTRLVVDGDAGYRRKEFTFLQAWLFRLEVLLTSLFLFFAITALVSFTLQQTQTRMLEFTTELRQRIGRGLPSARIVVRHVLYSVAFVPGIVGILFFLFNFFHDQFVALAVMLLAWGCEFLAVIGIRTRISMHFFPKVYALYFFIFGLYFFSFPSGFHYMALFVYALFLFHASIYFWSHHELPAIEGGLVTRERPRQLEVAAGIGGEQGFLNLSAIAEPQYRWRRGVQEVEGVQEEVVEEEDEEEEAVVEERHEEEEDPEAEAIVQRIRRHQQMLRHNALRKARAARSAAHIPNARPRSLSDDAVESVGVPYRGFELRRRRRPRSQSLEDRRVPAKSEVEEESVSDDDFGMYDSADF